MTSNASISRRLVLVCCLVPSLPVPAGSKAAKQDFSYQEKPRQGKSCSSCRMFIPAASGNPHCALVDGDISPTGWCMAYTPVAA